MIILQPNRELKREVIEADEIKLSKKLNDDVVIIPSCYDIVSMDDACEVVEVARDATESITNITRTSNNKTDTLSKEYIEDVCKAVKLVQEAIKGFRV